MTLINITMYFLITGNNRLDRNLCMSINRPPNKHVSFNPVCMQNLIDIRIRNIQQLITLTNLLFPTFRKINIRCLKLIIFVHSLCVHFFNVICIAIQLLLELISGFFKHNYQCTTGHTIRDGQYCNFNM